MTQSAFPHDLTDAEWNVLRVLLHPEAPLGRPLNWCLREILDSIFYVVRGRIAWQAMSHDFPPGKRSHLCSLWRLRESGKRCTRLCRRWFGGVSGKKQRSLLGSSTASLVGQNYRGGGHAATTVGRVSVDARVICSSTRWVWSWSSRYMRQIFKGGVGVVLLLRDLSNVFPRMQHV